MSTSPLVSIFPSPSPPGLPTNAPSVITLTTLQRHTQTGVSGGNGGGPGNPMASAALYLYTFLATLVLLIAISLFIIIRSIVQRRRRNRAIRDAWLRYTNGSIPFREGDVDLIRFVEFRMNQSAAGARGGRIDLTQVPAIWEVHLTQKNSIDSEKTAEGKSISSSWKLHQRSIPYFKSGFPPSWAWYSILPLSSTLLPPDEVTASIEDGPTPDFSTMAANSNGRRNVPLSGVGRFFGRMLNGSGSLPASGRRTTVVNDQRGPNTPASASGSPSATAINPNANPVDSVDGNTPTPIPSYSEHNRRRTDTDIEIQLEEGTRGISGSSSHPHPHNSSPTHPNMGQALPVTITNTAEERFESTATYPSDQPQPGQGTVGETHVSPNITLPSRNQIQISNQNHPLAPDQSQVQKSSLGMVDKGTRMRVAVLVRMPTPPTPSPHFRLSKAESKAKAKAESGYDEKRLSSFSRNSVSTLGGGEKKDDTDTDGANVPPLEVGLADVDMFSDCGG